MLTNSENKINLKVLCCQLDCKMKQVEKNISKVEAMLEKYSKNDDIDVVLLPEMAFTGYHFKNKEDIELYLEKQTEGPTFTFCSTLAKKLNCYVMCGYPEIFIDSNKPEGEQKQFYNSAYIINRDGSLLTNYRKHHLYEVDHRWSLEGEKFMTVELINNKNQKFKACVAICMDINCYEFKDSSQFELAEFCKNEQIDALFFLTAWKDSDENSNTKDSQMDVINYWLYRLTPIINTKQQNKFKKWIFFVANRIGREENTVFNGCSCGIKVNPVQLIKNLDKRKEQLLMIDDFL